MSPVLSHRDMQMIARMAKKAGESLSMNDVHVLAEVSKILGPEVTKEEAEIAALFSKLAKYEIYSSKILSHLTFLTTTDFSLSDAFIISDCFHLHYNCCIKTGLGNYFLPRATLRLYLGLAGQISVKKYPIMLKFCPFRVVCCPLLIYIEKNCNLYDRHL